MILYVMMTTELFIHYFCNIKLCCLWTFDDQMSVIDWEIICVTNWFIFIVLGKDTSTPGSMEGLQRCDKGVIEGRGLAVPSGRGGN